MKFRIALLAILLATPAIAQQAPEKTYQLTVTVSDLGVIAQGLGEVQSKLANPVIAKLNTQIQAADAPKPADEKTKP